MMIAIAVDRMTQLFLRYCTIGRPFGSGASLTGSLSGFYSAAGLSAKSGRAS